MNVAFGDFQLDLDGCELTRAGRPVALERRPTELLCLLASRPAELVGRRELADRIWGAASGVDVDMGINTAIRKIRLALGDETNAPRHVETVQGRGYRFVAPLRQVQAADSDAAGQSVTIAVLPFDNLTGSDEYDYLAEGFTEELIASLGAISPEKIQIIGRRSVVQFRSSLAEYQEIGRVLGASHILEGSVRQDQAALRVTARLVQARSGKQIWSGIFDGTPDQTLAFQQTVSRSVSEQVRAHFAPSAPPRTGTRHTQIEAAYNLYLRGRHCWNRNQSATNKEAIGYFSRATALDVNYALAWSGLADTYSVSPVNSDVSALAIWREAHDSAARALRSGRDLAEANTSFGFVRFWLDWRWHDAVEHFRRAALLDPNYASAHRMVGIACAHLGFDDEARRAIRLSVELDPLSAMHHALSAQIAFFAGDLAEAASFARDAIEVDQRFWIGHFQLAQAMERCNEPAAAMAALGDAAKTCGNSSKPAMLEAYILAKSGERGAAHARLLAFAETAKTRFVPPYAIALIHLGLNDMEQALTSLEHALAVRDVNLSFLPRDPKWDGLRDEPRFRALIERCGFFREPEPGDGADGVFRPSSAALHGAADA